MTHVDRRQANLDPARYGEAGGPEGFRSAFPWRVLLGIALVFAFIISLHLYLTHRRVEGLRAEVMQLIDAEIVPLSGELGALRERISGFVLERYRSESFDSPFVARGFDIDALREAPVLTLRLGRRGELGGDEVGLVVEHGVADDIGSCLGVPNQPASELYEGGDFLGESFIETVRTASSELELRGIRDQLGRRISEVLPKLREASRSGLMILSIDREDEAKIEVSVVELDTGRDRMRLLAKAEGAFLSAKIDLGGVRAPRSQGEPLEVRGAIDCGVASQIKALLTSPQAD